MFKNVIWASYKIPVILLRFKWNCEIYENSCGVKKISEKFSNIKFNENPSSGS